MIVDYYAVESRIRRGSLGIGSDDFVQSRDHFILYLKQTGPVYEQRIKLGGGLTCINNPFQVALGVI